MLHIKKIAPDDIHSFQTLIKVFGETFEMKDFKMPSTTYLLSILDKPNFMAFIAEEDGRIIGGLTAFRLDLYYSEKPLAYIYDLAVLPAFQRRGNGQQLIKFFNNYCREHGYEEVFVQADLEDIHAVEFYKKTRPTNAEDVIHFYYTL